MRENSTPFELTKMGLRKDSVNQLNVPGLIECVGFRLGGSGLEVNSPVTNQFSSTVLEAAFDWPFPQLFDFAGATYLLSRHYIYEVASDWTLTQIAAWFTSGSRWDAADLGNFVMFANGSVVLINDPPTGDFRHASSSDYPVCGTACAFRGQLFAGKTALGNNYVQWGNIGYNYWTVDRSNEAGNRHMPWAGNVLRVKPLADGIVVYGESGIGLLVPKSEPTITYGLAELADYGLQSRDTVDGDWNVHLFIDEAGYLRRLTKQGIENLGYQEFFSSWSGSSVGIVYNPIEKEFYLSNGTESYVLTEQGLTGIDVVVAGGAVVDGVFVSVIKELAPTYKTLVTNPFDFGLRTGKTITQVFLPSSDAAYCQVAFDWRSGAGSSFARSPFFPFSPEGVSDITVYGTEFRMALRWPSARSPDLNGRVDVSWKSDDKRSVRGMYAPTKSNA